MNGLYRVLVFIGFFLNGSPVFTQTYHPSDLQKLQNILTNNDVYNQITWEVDVANNTFEQTGFDIGWSTEEPKRIVNLKIDRKELVGKLDVSNLTELVTLSCDKNELDTIDASGNSLLKVVFCAQNNLKALELENCNSLFYLDCKENQLSQLNVMDKLSLKTLYVQYNRLSLSSLNAINELNSIQRKTLFPQLKVAFSQKSTFETINDTLDLRTESILNETTTDMIWKDDFGSEVIIQKDEVENENAVIKEVSQGQYVFLKPGKYYIELSNSTLDNGKVNSITYDVKEPNAFDLTDLRVLKTILTDNDAQNNLNWEIDLTNNTLENAEEVTWNNADPRKIIELSIAERGLYGILNLNNLSQLERLDCSNNHLEGLYLKNSNNLNLSSYNSRNNPSLSCVEVDDTEQANTNWILKDEQTSFSTSCEKTVAVTEFPSNVIKIHPQPVKNRLTVDLDLKFKTIQLHSLTGKVLGVYAHSNINVSSLSEGIYLIGIELENGQHIVRKWVKE